MEGPMRHFKKIMLALVALFATTLSTLVSAEEVVWSTPAMACTPSSGTVAENKYITTAGVIKYQNGKGGNIVFICPINTPLPEGYYAVLGFIKTPTSDRNWGINIQLRRRDNFSNKVETLAASTFIYSTPPSIPRGYVSSLTQRIEESRFGHTYWIQLSYRRNSNRIDDSSIVSVQLLHYKDAVKSPAISPLESFNIPQ